MRRVIVITVAGACLAGCSSFSFDSLKPAPPTVQVQLESVPSGAEATTSLGPGCKTPCSVAVPAPDSGFSVTYALNKFQPVTVPVQVIHIPGDFSTPASTTLDPSPVVAELQPAAPPPKAVRKVLKPSKPKTRDGHGRGAASWGIAIPAAPASTAAARPLIACTAPDKVRIVRASHHA
jgi:hypothetical protein